jgi:hypothetical protein
MLLCERSWRAELRRIVEDRRYRGSTLPAACPPSLHPPSTTAVEAVAVEAMMSDRVKGYNWGMGEVVNLGGLAATPEMPIRCDFLRHGVPLPSCPHYPT